MKLIIFLSFQVRLKVSQLLMLSQVDPRTLENNWGQIIFSQCLALNSESKVLLYFWLLFRIFSVCHVLWLLIKFNFFCTCQFMRKVSKYVFQAATYLERAHNFFLVRFPILLWSLSSDPSLLLIFNLSS